MTPQILSPIHDTLAALNPVWSNDNRHPGTVLGFDNRDKQKAAVLGLADVSLQPRAGAKGRGTADWLSGLGIPVPPVPNSWSTLPNGGLIARLGMTEFLVEGNAELVGKVMRAERTAGVYPVLRQDAAFALCGTKVNELLLQTCNVDFRTLDANPTHLVLTSMAGVGVTVLRANSGGIPSYRIWCDGTYGIYLWETLAAIANELGGGCIGLEALL